MWQLLMAGILAALLMNPTLAQGQASCDACFSDAECGAGLRCVTNTVCLALCSTQGDCSNDETCLDPGDGGLTVCFPDDQCVESPPVPSVSPVGMALLVGLVFAIAVAGLAVQHRRRAL